MSNERIDLTQEELRERLFQEMTKDYDANSFIDNTDEWYSIDEIMDGIEHLGLIAELKRCYEEIDELKSKIEDITLAVENNNIDYLMNCL
jgi:hypothetical protein|tara:strand:+ start:752 stop:1021 length:270 start_codon:yes stop_codon:yes gene_type:complete